MRDVDAAAPASSVEINVESPSTTTFLSLARALHVCFDMIAQANPPSATPGERSFAAVRISGRRLDASSRRELMAAVDGAWLQGATVVALDFSEIEEVDSVGISVLIALHRKRPAGAKIVLCVLNDYARDVFEVTQLFRVFDVFDTVESVRVWQRGR